MGKLSIQSKFPSTKAPPLARTGSRLPAWLIPVLLALVTTALYWPALRCGFINLDDPDLVTENPHVQAGLNWEAVKWAFANTEQAAYWAPLMWLSHMLAWQIFGSNPWGHHLINVLLHAANTALVFLVFRRMTGATWRCVALAALFGWHPLRVESVAWITERKDVLSTFFWMLTLWAYARCIERSEVRSPRFNIFYCLALVFFILGLMSKAMLVTLPFVLLLLDYWPLGRFKPSTLWQLVREKFPFFALAAAVGAVTFVAQSHGGTVMTMESLPLGARLGNALISYCRYLGKMFWPVDLAVFYPHPGYWPLEQVLMAGAFLGGISALLYANRRRRPFLLVGWLWFVGTLVPVIGLVQAGDVAMADRFSYVPSLGLLIIIIWGGYDLARNWRYHAILLTAAGSAAAILCFVATRHQLGYWQNSETLFRHTLEVTENNYVAHLNLGFILFNQGQPDGAIRQFQEAIRLKPDNPDVHINLGVALLNQGHADGAIRQFREAVGLKPDYADAHLNLGFALFNLGQSDAAGGEFEEVIRLKPDSPEAHYNLAVVLGMKGRTDEAIRQYRETIRLKPDYTNAQIGLANALELMGKSHAGAPGPAVP